MHRRLNRGGIPCIFIRSRKKLYAGGLHTDIESESWVLLRCKKGRVFIQFVKVTFGDMRGEKNPAVMYEPLIKDLIR